MILGNDVLAEYGDILTNGNGITCIVSSLHFFNLNHVCSGKIHKFRVDGTEIDLTGIYPRSASNIVAVGAARTRVRSIILTPVNGGGIPSKGGAFGRE